MTAQGQPAPTPGSLVERLARKLRESEGASEPAAEAAEPAAQAVLTATQRRVGEAQNVVRLVTSIVAVIKERMDLLDAVCQSIGRVPPRRIEVHPQLSFYEPRLQALVRADEGAARMLGSVIERYREIAVELAKLKAQIEHGLVPAGVVERLKGRYLFLCNIQVYFKDFPLLNHLFNPKMPMTATTSQAENEWRQRYALYDGSQPKPASRILQAQARAPVGRAAPTGRLAATPGPARASGPQPQAVPMQGDSLQKGESQVVAPAKTAPLVNVTPRDPKEQALVARATALAEGLAPKMAIVRAALKATGGTAKLEAVALPGPARQTAAALGDLLATDPALLPKTKRALAAYDELRRLLQRPTLEAPPMRTLVVELGSLPATFKDVSWLGRLFTID